MENLGDLFNFLGPVPVTEVEILEQNEAGMVIAATMRDLMLPNAPKNFLRLIPNTLMLGDCGDDDCDSKYHPGDAVIQEFGMCLN